jgi:hypothetical protein
MYITIDMYSVLLSRTKNRITLTKDIVKIERRGRVNIFSLTRLLSVSLFSFVVVILVMVAGGDRRDYPFTGTPIRLIFSPNRSKFQKQMKVSTDKK